MANPSFSVPDVELDMLDDIRYAKIEAGELERGHSRSSELRKLIIRYINENAQYLESESDYETRYRPYARDCEELTFAESD
jgi:hypothetical protein